MTIRALVVDDSALMRRIVSDILNADPSIEVVGTARDGKDAVEKTQRLNPDVITMDVEMPEMNGIEAVKRIMSSDPTPVLMLSAVTTKGAEVTLDALNAGAVDFICKPSGSISTDLETIGEGIVSKVKFVAGARVRQKEPLLSVEPSNVPVGSKIKVLLVDDSAFFIKTTKDIINQESDMEVIDVANNGLEAIEYIKTNTPDVIIMDLEMPEMDGVKATFEILKEHFIPIIIFSSKTSDDMDDVKTALELGAVDFIAKPANQMSMRSISSLFVNKIRDARDKKIQKICASPGVTATENILLIGTSTGGPQTLTELIPYLPADIPAGVLIVQHMPPVFTKSLANRLDKLSHICVKEAEEGDEILPGNALLAPGDYHMTVYEKEVDGMKKRYVSLNQDERMHGVRPAVDITFSSAVNYFGSNTVGIILTGMGQDGANSMGSIKARGGHTIVQDEKTSIIFGMPDAAIKLGVVDEILPLDQIASHAVHVLNSLNRKGAG